MRCRRLAACLGLGWALAACHPKPPSPVWPAFGGDVERGRLILASSGCGACHNIPGITGARGLAAPPLTDFGRRTVIAGVLPNTPENLIRWVREPQSVIPHNAMPNTGLGDSQARDVAAYLYALE